MLSVIRNIVLAVFWNSTRTSISVHIDKTSPSFQVEDTSTISHEMRCNNYLKMCARLSIVLVVVCNSLVIGVEFDCGNTIKVDPMVPIITSINVSVFPFQQWAQLRISVDSKIFATGFAHLTPESAQSRIGEHERHAKFATPLVAEVYKVTCTLQRANGHSDPNVVWKLTQSFNTSVSVYPFEVEMRPDTWPTAWTLTSPALYNVNCSVDSVTVRYPARKNLNNTLYGTENVSRETPRGAGCVFRKSTSVLASTSTRFGFRDFEASVDGQFLLNSMPIFLRGNSMNPPGRGLPTALSDGHVSLLPV